MIEASFDRNSRQAAVSGVYQYDTGQRLRMNGLPSPDELLAGDDLLSGDLVTVQVHFGYEGDDQTDMRLAQWDDERWCWVADIPDSYLTRIDPVHVYVYVYHGESGEDTRARTMYEGVFSAISRPAPNNMVSEDMLENWAKLEAEVDLVLVSAETAITNAQTYAKSATDAAPVVAAAGKDAQDAAQEANTQIDRLEAMERMWNDADVRIVDLPTESDAYVEWDGGALVCGIPVGAQGEKGETGEPGPGDIELSFEGGILTITPK